MIPGERLADLYLNLLKSTLTGLVYEDPPLPMPWLPLQPYDAAVRAQGSDWPSHAPTMIGLDRLDHLQHCVETVLEEDVPGDLLEAGVWRGGACILMRAILKAHGDLDRRVWVADSFQGLQRHAPGHEALAVPLEQVCRNFGLYGLMDGQVQFVPGWFSESLPGPVGKLALLRLDGDQYQAQMPVLESLYPRLSPGGYVIVDDYPGIEETRLAVDEYRAREGIVQEIQLCPNTGWWRK